MKNTFFTILVVAVLLIISCKSGTENQSTSELSKNESPELAKVIEEQFDIVNDSLKFNSATIENFNKEGNSIDVYWLNNERDTILRFYRKYNAKGELIGAEYYEEGDTEASKDTVYTNENGLKVEASLNAEGKITWKSTIQTDENGNEILRTYENSKGEPRGLDSLFFDDKNRPIKGFYKNANGKKYSTKTYKYLAADQFDHWTERNLLVNDTLSQKHFRVLEYH